MRNCSSSEPIRYLDVSEQAVIALLRRQIDSPVLMLNLLHFRDVADYSATPALAPNPPISGKEAYTLYIAHSKPFLSASGGEILLLGDGGQFLIGPQSENWDWVMLIKQQSLQDFLAFANNSDYLAGIAHRQAALQDSRLLPISPTYLRD